MSNGLYTFLIFFNIVLTFLAMPGFLHRKQFKSKAMRARAWVAGFAVICLWIVILYQTVKYHI
ncbi:hypothetical protein ACI7RC_14255 [Brevibacillus sp. B_LB10_24]|uniref:hypothetical protein n=1 Tax=Brevibacillus sp. B_LB10_24 TaxID=3380645 RepID=UPI0038BBE648